MDSILIIMAVFLFVFIITMIIAIWRTGGSFDTLIDKVIGACCGEGGIMGAIKISKILKGELKNDE